MSFYLRDLLVCGKPSLKLTKSLAVIADMLHDEWARDGYDISKYSCVLSSLCVRDFLFQAGIHDATVEPVYTYMEAQQNGAMIHNLGIGKPDEPATSKRHWSGHMVVVSRQDGYLIDTTLYQAHRTQWPHLPNMIATPLTTTDKGASQFQALSGLHNPVDENGYSFDVTWYHTPDNIGWKRAPDIENLRRRRKRVVEKMTEMLKSGSGN